MNEKILQVDTFKDGMTAIIAAINSRTIDLASRHILIVPDNYTLSAETQLFEHSFGAFDAEVLTFARLFYRYGDETDYLDASGAVMMIRSISEQAELTCYKKSAHHAGFAEKVYDTIRNLEDRGINPLTACSSVSGVSSKLGDIKTIYSKYKERLKGKFIDSEGRLELLAAAMERANLSNVHFYIANFMELTSGEARVVDAIKKHAASLTRVEVSSTEPPVKASSIEVYDCGGSAAALKAAARRIRDAVIGGMRYKDICIATSSLVFTEAERIFSEYQIPFYTDHAYSLIDHPLSVYILSIVEIIEKKYRRRDMIELVKNVYSGISKPQSDNFENFCNEFNVDYLAFLDEFTVDKYASKDELRLKKAEVVRSATIKALQSLEKSYKSIGSALDFAAFVRRIIARAKANNPDELGKENIHLEAAADKIEEVICLMERVLLDRSERPKMLFEVFIEGLNRGRISAIPNLSDSVIVGTPTTFRGTGFRYVFVLGMNEGVIPAPREEVGLLARDEHAIEGLQSSTQNQNTIELAHLLNSASDKIFISYDSTAESGMSSYLKSLLIDNADKIQLSSEILEAQRLFGDEATEFVSEFCCSKAGTAELLISNISSFKTTGHIAHYNGALYAALKGTDADKYLETRHIEQTIDSQGLYFASDSVSVSRLQEYYNCPYSHFIRYGLRAKPQKDGELLPIDIGSLLHEAVEIFALRRDEWDDVAASCKTILAQILEKNRKLSLKLKPKMYALLESETIEVCTILKAHFEAGSFSAMGQEISLESTPLLKPLSICARGRSIRLIGSVDYADIFENSVRIIDYKTGYAKFSYSDIYYGRKLQLPLYMQAFLKSGYEAAGFFYFPFSRKWTDDERSHRLRGVFCENPEILCALDHNLSQGALSNIITVKTAIKNDELVISGRRDYALSQKQLQTLCDYSEKSAQKAIGEILDGYIAPRPYQSGRFSACDVCEYTSICGKIDASPRQLTETNPLEVYSDNQETEHSQEIAAKASRATQATLTQEASTLTQEIASHRVQTALTEAFDNSKKGDKLA